MATMFLNFLVFGGGVVYGRDGRITWWFAQQRFWMKPMGRVFPL